MTGLSEASQALPPTGLNRRDLLKRTLAIGAVSLLGGLGAPFVARASAPYELPRLPWPENGLEPAISARTIGFHYGKHHKAYVDNLNKLLADAPDLAGLGLEELIRTTASDPDRIAVFNNAAQNWNHTFYWNSMRPKGGGKPSGALLQKIEADFGGWDAFAAEFAKAAQTQFAANRARVIVRDDDPPISIDIPLPYKAAEYEYEVLVGFQLTPEELAYNQRWQGLGR